MLLCFLVAGMAGAQVELPPKPTNYLADQGVVFPPPVAERIVSVLEATARDFDVHIYVITMPTLKVMPSRAREKLEELSRLARADWLRGRIGAVIIFDDEAGGVVMGPSEKAREAFSPVALNVVFSDPRLQSKKKRSAPERLANAVTLLTEQFTELRTKQLAEERKRWRTNLWFGGICAVALLLIVAAAIFKVRAHRKERGTRRRHRVHLHT